MSDNGRKQPARAEQLSIHSAAVALRRLGTTVYRSGADHKVGGRLLSTSQLLELARAAQAAGVELKHPVAKD